MIDTIYKTLLTILNKENQGYISPQEFDLLANNVQNEIYRSYFEDINKDKIKENKGYTTAGYGNLAFNERHKIEIFSSSVNLETNDDGEFELPSDLYFIEDSGITSKKYGQVIEGIDKTTIGYLLNSLSKPTPKNAVYEKYGNKIVVHPDTITEIRLRYLRTPKSPKWAYFTTGSGANMFNPSSSSFQDFELHESEFTNIVNRMLLYFGINLREAEIVSIAQTLKDKLTYKEES